jgi:hypothetical protein
MPTKTTRRMGSCHSHSAVPEAGFNLSLGIEMNMRGIDRINPGTENFRIFAAMAKKTQDKSTTGSVVQIKISLQDSHPPIWRRVVIDPGCSFLELHFICQLAMGWTNSHLAEFNVEGQRIGLPDTEFELDDKLTDAASITLSEVLKNFPGLKKFQYWYDFGDDWYHIITIEKTLDADRELSIPRCIDGARACPPEDCGGIHGYEELLETLANPNHPDHSEMKEWVDEDFDPEAFDIADANHRLASLKAEIKEWQK